MQSEHKTTDWMPLCEAPEGVLKTRSGTLLFKSEYKTRNERTGLYQTDAYVLSSGEYWWGGHKDIGQREAEMVRPVEFSVVRGGAEVSDD